MPTTPSKLGEPLLILSRQRRWGCSLQPGHLDEGNTGGCSVQDPFTLPSSGTPAMSCLCICMNYKSLHIPQDKTYKLKEHKRWDWEHFLCSYNLYVSWNWKHKKHNFSSSLLQIDIARFAKTERGPCHFTALQNQFPWAVNPAMTGSHSALQWAHRPGCGVPGNGKG